MKTILYKLVEYAARIHNKLLSLNDAYETHFSDKQMHFLVIGIVGMLLIFVVHPIFAALARRGHVMVISWVYVFTLILVLTFAIEIGQKITGSGVMEFEDIVFGIAGFILMFAVFAIIRGIIKAIVSYAGKRRQH